LAMAQKKVMECCSIATDRKSINSTRTRQQNWRVLFLLEGDF
jgi:hypothetical protein